MDEGRFMVCDRFQGGFLAMDPDSINWVCWVVVFGFREKKLSCIWAMGLEDRWADGL